MADSIEFDPVDWITAGSVGPPGQRTFYIQARRGDELMALVVEKSQVILLVQVAQELLARAGVAVTPDDLEESSQRLVEPVAPSWRAGSMSLGMDDDGERFVLEAEELIADDETDAPAEARFWMSRQQVVALAAHGAFAVEHGARETCHLCSRPIDPEAGHVCPALNGHGPLTV
ncbi:MAG TPA: DUF3090 family protein [Egibacteraceae bacterium]|nr:DUF3090 family protein [Egibacteraceae bacterium]